MNTAMPPGQNESSPSSAAITEPATLPVPEPFRDAFAGLEEQRWRSDSENPFKMCFGCGSAHPNGLHVRSFKTPEGVASPIIISRQHEGPPGNAHGGIIATYLDEVLAATVLRLTSSMAVTGELNVRYLKPVPTETPLVGRGSLVADHGRYLEVEARLEDLHTGNILATGRGVFFPIKR